MDSSCDGTSNPSGIVDSRYIETDYFRGQGRAIALFRSLELICHRGFHRSGAPENSLSSLFLAFQGGWGAEVDLRCTADGQVVLLHDHNTRNSTGHNGLVAEMTYDEISALRLLKSTEGIPLLSTALKRYPTLPLLLDPKQQSEIATAEVVAKHGAENRVIMIVHELEVAEILKARFPQIPLCLTLGSRNRIIRLTGNTFGAPSRSRKILDLCKPFAAVSIGITALFYDPVQLLLESDKLIFGYRPVSYTQYQRCLNKRVVPVTAFYPR